MSADVPPEAFATDLERACDERADAVMWFRVDPLLDDLRDVPRFMDIMRRVGLADKAPGRDESSRCGHRRLLCFDC